MEGLQQWMTEQLNGHKTEPNSGLGKAMKYLLRHWQKLTLFLHQAGAPLDNNICERALKMVVLLRKNALFYRTQHGADVGDLFTSLIHTCDLNKVNSFDYLTELQRHAAELKANPAYSKSSKKINRPSRERFGGHLGEVYAPRFCGIGLA